MSICRWCYETEATTFDGLCQECADAIRKEKKEAEQFDLDSWLKEDNSMKYKVYVIDSKGYYAGNSLVAAESVEEANNIIDAFIKDDPHNYANSRGYCHVEEYEVINGVYSEQKGIIYRGIYYTG